MQLTYGPRKLSEYVGLKDEPGELLEPAHLIGDGLQVVLLQVQDTQPTHNTSNIGSNALPLKVCSYVSATLTLRIQNHEFGIQRE
jgi:hypothetical protein